MLWMEALPALLMAFEPLQAGLVLCNLLHCVKQQAVSPCKRPKSQMCPCKLLLLLLSCGFSNAEYIQPLTS